MSERLADLLFAHTGAQCADPDCGDGFGYHDCETSEERRRGCAHLADVLTAHIGEVLEQVREDVADALYRDRIKRTVPDTVPEALDADAALTVVREALGCPPDALGTAQEASEVSGGTRVHSEVSRAGEAE